MNKFSLILNYILSRILKDEHTVVNETGFSVHTEYISSLGIEIIKDQIENQTR